MKRILLSLVILSITATAVFSEVPNEIRYNGRLKAYQTPVNGTKQINFKIYPAANGGTALWESGNQNIEVHDGIFSHTLSPNIDWRKKDLWLEIAVDNKSLSPREKIMAQSYALHANSAESLSSNSEILITVNASSSIIGVNSKGEIYSKTSSSEYYMVPKGAIILWSGSKSDIPEGWALCDGTNGTPNLQGRFVLGQGTMIEDGNVYVFSTGETSGEVKHKLTIDEMPTHSHTITLQLDNQGGGTGVGTWAQRGGAHSIETSYSGGDNSHNNMPPYYVLCYIMKL